MIKTKTPIAFWTGSGKFMNHSIIDNKKGKIISMTGKNRTNNIVLNSSITPNASIAGLRRPVNTL